MLDGHMKGDVILELFEDHLWVIQVSGRCGIICGAVLKKKLKREGKLLKYSSLQAQVGKRRKCLGRVA